MSGFGTVVILIMLTDLYPVHVFIPKNKNHVRFEWMSVGVFNENKDAKVLPYVKQIMQLKCRFCLFWLRTRTHTQAYVHRHSQWKQSCKSAAICSQTNRAIEMYVLPILVWNVYTDILNDAYTLCSKKL